MSDLAAGLAAAVAAFEGTVGAVDDLRQDRVFRSDRTAIHDFLRRLKEDGALRFEVLHFITAVDNYLEEPRFEVVYQLRSLLHNADLRVHAPVPGNDPEIASVTDLFPAADWFEREVWDMFGVRFANHPGLERILMWEGFEGHPLRKDYPLLGNTPRTPGFHGKGGKP